jgi:hypothetical protein
MKLDLVGPMVGANCHGFMIGFVSTGAYGCKEQWYMGDMRV